MTQKYVVVNIIGVGASGSTALGHNIAKSMQATFLGEITKKYKLEETREFEYLKSMEFFERNFLFFFFPNSYDSRLPSLIKREILDKADKVVVLTSKSFYLTRALQREDDIELVTICLNRRFHGYVKSRFKHHYFRRTPVRYILGRILAFCQYCSLRFSSWLISDSISLKSNNLSSISTLLGSKGEMFRDDRIAGGDIRETELYDLK